MRACQHLTQYVLLQQHTAATCDLTTQSITGGIKCLCDLLPEKEGVAQKLVPAGAFLRNQICAMHENLLKGHMISVSK